MKKYTKTILLISLIAFIVGVLFSVAGSALGGNFFRATSNINRLMENNNIITFEFATPAPTAVPYTDPFDEFFGGSDIFDIFEEFGMGDDFFSPYGNQYGAPSQSPGKIY